jgi:serine/threonine protein phosphatase PrpC
MTGRRQTNEDDEICVDQFCGDKSVAYFGLYDGHGGRQSVDYVVKALHLSLEHLLREHPDMPVAEALTRAYVMTDGQLRRRNILQSGTTGVSVVIKRDPRGRRVLYAANVGDSRAVVSRGGSAMRLTVDHKPNLPEERKRIEEAGGWINEKRVNGVLAISRALGDHMLKSNNVITAVPYVFELELTDNEDYLILVSARPRVALPTPRVPPSPRWLTAPRQACDGVWDVMTDQEAVDFVLQQMSEVDADGPDLNRELEQCARNLVQAAYDKKSMDNITVIVVRL